MQELYWDKSFKHPKNAVYSGFAFRPTFLSSFDLMGDAFKPFQKRLALENRLLKNSLCLVASAKRTGTSLFSLQRGEKVLIQQVLQWVKADAEVGEVV